MNDGKKKKKVNLLIILKLKNIYTVPYDQSEEASNSRLGAVIQALHFTIERFTGNLFRVFKK